MTAYNTTMVLHKVVPFRAISLTTKLRHPSIKFRYGPAREQSQKSSEPQSAASGSSKGAQAAQQEAIYDFQLPPRFRRRLLSEEEIAYINRGGPE